MTNGELFKKENPDIEVKINGSCVWIYYFDGVNHYTIPTDWWNKEIGVFEDIRAEIDHDLKNAPYLYDEEHLDELYGFQDGVEHVLHVIDRHMKGANE